MSSCCSVHANSFFQDEIWSWCGRDLTVLRGSTSNYFIFTFSKIEMWAKYEPNHANGLKVLTFANGTNFLLLYLLHTLKLTKASTNPFAKECENRADLATLTVCILTSDSSSILEYLQALKRSIWGLLHHEVSNWWTPRNII